MVEEGEKWASDGGESVTEQTGGVHNILLRKGSPLSLSGGPPHTLTRFAMPATRGKMSLNAETGEKERNYLFKSYTVLE